MRDCSRFFLRDVPLAITEVGERSHTGSNDPVLRRRGVLRRQRHVSDEDEPPPLSEPMEEVAPLTGDRQAEAEPREANARVPQPEDEKKKEN